jgi:hypothetical protein
MPKFLVSYTFRYHGEAQFRRTFHEQDEELTQEDIQHLEEEIKSEPAYGVPDDSVVRVLSVCGIAADRPKPVKPGRKGCAAVVAIAAVTLLARTAAAFLG